MHNGIAGLAQQEICISLHLAQLPGELFNPSNQSHPDVLRGRHI